MWSARATPPTARGSEALLPRGSTRVEAGDRLLVLVRREVAQALPELLERWRSGPVHKPIRPPRTYTGSVPIFTARPWSDADGDPAHPREVAGNPVVEHLRTRRDIPGALVILDDGRIAVTGPRSEEHTSELQSPDHLVCRLLLEKK